MSMITSTSGIMCTHDRAGTLYDLRSPLGISPAALRASKAAPQVMTGLRPVKEQGYSAYQSYRKTRVDLLKTQNKKRLKAVAVDFRRIWWDKGMRGGSKEGAGIWRPVPPQGYVSLGNSFDTCHAPFATHRCGQAERHNCSMSLLTATAGQQLIPEQRRSSAQ